MRPTQSAKSRLGSRQSSWRGGVLMNDAELLAAVIFGVVLAFYFMFMRPIQKEQSRHKKQMRDLRPGDQVLTTSNFVATVKDIQVGEDGQTRIALELADGVVVTAMP